MFNKILLKKKKKKKKSSPFIEAVLNSFIYLKNVIVRVVPGL